MSKSIDDPACVKTRHVRICIPKHSAHINNVSKRERADRFVMHTCIVLISFVIGFVLGVAV